MLSILAEPPSTSVNAILFGASAMFGYSGDDFDISSMVCPAGRLPQAFQSQHFDIPAVHGHSCSVENKPRAAGSAFKRAS